MSFGGEGRCRSVGRGVVVRRGGALSFGGEGRCRSAGRGVVVGGPRDVPLAARGGGGANSARHVPCSCMVSWWEADSGHGPSRHGRPEPLPGPLADCVSYALHVAGRAATRGLKAVLEPTGLDLREFGALAAIVSIGRLTQRELAARLSIDRTTAGAVVRALELEGLIERQPSTRDPRYVSLRPTPYGAEQLEGVLNAVAEAEAAFLDRLSPTQRTGLRDLLKALGPPERVYLFG